MPNVFVSTSDPRLEKREVCLACIPQSEDRRRMLAIFTDFVTTPYTGSVDGTCATCGCGVWVGPNQQGIIEDLQQAKTYCLDCIRDRIVVQEIKGEPGIMACAGNREHTVTEPA